MLNPQREIHHQKRERELFLPGEKAREPPLLKSTFSSPEMSIHPSSGEIVLSFEISCETLSLILSLFSAHLFGP